MISIIYKDEQGRSEEIQVRNSTVFLGNKTKQKIYISNDKTYPIVMQKKMEEYS